VKTAVWLLLALPWAAHGGEVSVGVLGLFHSERLVLEAAGDSLSVRVDGNELEIREPLALVLANGAIQVGGPHDQRSGAVVSTSGDFILSVPAELSRRYRGELRISAQGSELLAVIAMDREAAVAAVLAKEAEDEPHAAALEAQAIVSRSFFAAGARHQGFDFCDTTHCQWLGEIPDADSDLARATRDTDGLVLRSRGETVQALFSPQCGGRTRTLAEVGLEPDGYPFYAVACELCRRDSDAWERTLSMADAHELFEQPGFESARLAVVRRLGWSMLPSNSYSLDPQGERVVIQGRGSGHGVGLCQAGAGDLAARGMSARRILRVYFPNTVVSRR